MLEIKYFVIEMKNPFHKLISRLDTARIRIWLELNSTETSQTKNNQTEKTAEQNRMPKNY